jgi:hypothetical protein
MPYKDPAKKREAWRKHYAKHQPYYAERQRKRKIELKEFLRLAKDNQPCTDCGVKYPYYVMDFDHRDPSTKLDSVSILVTQNQSWKRIQEEIAKCDLVCSNCHRERTYGPG